MSRRNRRKKSKSKLSPIFKILWGIVMLFLLYFIVLVTHGTMNDYQPEEIIALSPIQNSSIELLKDSTASFVIWNTGYGGLGAKSNFFYDGQGALLSAGKMVRSPEEFVDNYTEGAIRFIRTHEADFYLFQEVDRNSKRSYYKDLFQLYLNQLPNYDAYYAQNLLVARMPIPILEPWKAYGKVNSGLASFSKYHATKATRFQLPGEYFWPTSIFQLDRCVLQTRYKHKNGKELIVMNIHNSAFDDGSLKTQQMDYLKEMAINEYQKGNYVILGGDWNQCPPYFKFDGFSKTPVTKYHQSNIDATFYPEGWNWIYDPSIPSNRKVDKVYVAGKTFVTIIDFYLLSPNLKALEVKTVNQNFEFSDHQPVTLTIQFL